MYRLLLALSAGARFGGGGRVELGQRGLTSYRIAERARDFRHP